jgi:hypothetical protein
VRQKNLFQLSGGLQNAFASALGKSKHSILQDNAVFNFNHIVFFLFPFAGI